MENLFTSKARVLSGDSDCMLVQTYWQTSSPCWVASTSYCRAAGIIPSPHTRSFSDHALSHCTTCSRITGTHPHFPLESVIWKLLESLPTSSAPPANSCCYCQVRHSQGLQRHLQQFHLLVPVCSPAVPATPIKL